MSNYSQFECFPSAIEIHIEYWKKMDYFVWEERNKISFFNLIIIVPVHAWNLRDHVQKMSRLHSPITILVGVKTIVRGRFILTIFSC